MHLTYYFIIILSLSKNIAATHASSEQWQKHLKYLSLIEAPVDPTTEVLEELEQWGPDQMNAMWKAPLWFKDIYFHDEVFRNTIKAYFLPKYIANCYEAFTGASASFPIDSLIHASELGKLSLRYAQALTELCCSEDSHAQKYFSLQDGAKSLSSALAHYCALSSNLVASIPVHYYSGDPIDFAATKVTAHLFRMAGYAFAGTAAFLAMEGEFIDVALRSLKRKYELAQKADRLAVVIKMLQKRKNQIPH